MCYLLPLCILFKTDKAFIVLLNLHFHFQLTVFWYYLEAL